MDKPLSQERLNYDELDKFLKMVESEPQSKQGDFFLGMCYELKRLQAIEAERDRYKSLVDSIDKQIAWGDPYQHVAKIGRWIKQFHEGVNDHESN